MAHTVFRGLASLPDKRFLLKRKDEPEVALSVKQIQQISAISWQTSPLCLKNWNLLLFYCIKDSLHWIPQLLMSIGENDLKQRIISKTDGSAIGQYATVVSIIRPLA